MQYPDNLGRGLFAACLLAAVPLAGQAQIKVGVTLSSTGPAASLGIPERNTVALLPKEVAGQKVEYIVLDDATDTTQAVRNMRKLVTEDKVDVMLGSTVTPASLAMLDVAAEQKVPMISVAASARIVAPIDDKRRWAFKTPQNDTLMAGALVDTMLANKVAKVAFIGFADAYGQNWLAEFKAVAEPKGISIVATESYARPDTSVTGQVLKLIASRPDAVLVAGAGTPAALPQTELRARGFKGPIYQTHGVANNDFLRVVGKDGEGTLLPAGPVLVAAQLPDSNPVKKAGLEYIERYEGAHGAGSTSTFGAHLWDAGLLVQAAIPGALATGAKPGTVEFRAALRDALENLKDVPASHGVFSMSATDHSGLDERARVMVKIENGKWVYLP
ncbi:ABC transporter substrate-binding protein [Paracandidimonas soli]|uniref:Amino acid/amide ABC transporter substrate-binding protein (HAAT family) n=1 Tax=Paracandidimonas soli TaxID=1917182 RepID=A0A4R3V6K2_9BURK|nr:ABC transporter substrate-binding protein [Paracandidimonas soli]TCU98988.1 amino acid/amide ABC transporter substrate-binding protein (HAAT family) [Paracandidimonas soli]